MDITRRVTHTVMLRYGLNYPIDLKRPVIVHVKATPTRISKEVDATEIMVERIQDRFDLKSVAARRHVRHRELIGWLIERAN